MEFLLFLGLAVILGFMGLFAWGLHRIEVNHQATEEARKNLEDRFGTGEYCVVNKNKHCIGINWERETFIIGDMLNDISEVPFRNIVAAEIEFDGATVTATKAVSRTNRGSQLVGAGVGAALAGPAGFIVGGLTGSTRTDEKSVGIRSINIIKVIVTTRDRQKPVRECIFYEDNFRNLPADDPTVKLAIDKARHFHALLSQVVEEQNLDDKTATMGVSPKVKVADQPEPTAERECPDCAETIKSAAKVCKHCGYRLDNAEPVDAPTQKAIDAAALTAPPDESSPARNRDETPKYRSFGAVFWAIVLTTVVVVGYHRLSTDDKHAGAQEIAAAPGDDPLVSGEIVAPVPGEMDYETPLTPDSHLDPAKISSICKAGIGELFGRSPDTMKTEQQSDGIVRVSYRRPDDGTLWKNDCRLEGNRIMWRAVDVSPGSGPGRWRNDPADEVLTYTMDGDKISVNISY